ncbi:hypothetical protein GOODEAATRI_029847, partial [Goodea atripinnis]
TDTSPQIQACSVAILLAPCASLSSCLTHHSLAAQVPTRHTHAQTHTHTKGSLGGVYMASGSVRQFTACRQHLTATYTCAAAHRCLYHQLCYL